LAEYLVHRHQLHFHLDYSLQIEDKDLGSRHIPYLC
jgi:hypothetical protein